MRALRLMGVAAALVFSAPSSVGASPWVLPKGRAVFWTGFNLQTAGQEFVTSSRAQDFPLDGRYTATSMVVGGRIGILDDLEVEVTLPVKVVSYEADPVLLLPAPESPPQGSDFDYYQENIIDLSQTRTGVADLQINARYRLLSGPIVAAAEVGIKAPMGYEQPEGTFGARPDSTEQFAMAPDRFVNPDNVSDDVTLGDGQVDLHYSLLLGWASRAGTFARLSAGYRLRLGGAGDQVTGLVRVGQALGQYVLVYGGATVDYTVQEGRIIGVSVGAQDPTLPASEYPADPEVLLNDVLELIELELARNILNVGGGVIIRLTRQLELNAGYEYTVWGRNTAALHSASASLALRVDIF